MITGSSDVNDLVNLNNLPSLLNQLSMIYFRVLHPITGRVVEVYSNQPGMQFYTGNLLPDPDKIFEVRNQTISKYDSSMT